MAGTLVFPVNEALLRIIAHSKTHPCRKPYTNEAAGPGFFLVKDSGVYLMSAALEGLRAEGSESSVVVYAEGHDPSQGECWDYDRDVCGGDDFGEYLEIADFERLGAILPGRRLVVRLTKRTIQLQLR